jgi:hypothetical protein
MTKRRNDDDELDWLKTQPLRVRRRYNRHAEMVFHRRRRWRDHHDWYLKLLARQMTEKVRVILACPIEERRFYDVIERKVRTTETP